MNLATSLTTSTRPLDFFVTGTDTEIGKTLCSSALLYALAQQGKRSLGLKPIASGAELRDGIWHYRPDVPPMASLELTHSRHAPEYEICIGTECHPLSERLPGLAGDSVVKISPCAESTAPGW